MQHGSLIFDFEAGRIVGVRSNPFLDSLYEDLFRRAYRSARRVHGSASQGIRLVVFGAFWIEARANTLLQKALPLESKDTGFGSALWRALKRITLPEKIALLSALGSDELSREYGDLSSGLRDLLEMRNRLAHFKDADLPISGPLASAEEAKEIILTAEDPPLIRELKRPGVLKHAQAVMALSRWLTRLERSHARRRGVRISVHGGRTRAKRSRHGALAAKRRH